jgi:hypothetical protein
MTNYRFLRLSVPWQPLNESDSLAATRSIDVMNSKRMSEHLMAGGMHQCSIHVPYQTSP